MRGQILVLALLFLSVILISTLSIFSLVGFFSRNATIGYFKEQSLHLAEAGVDSAITKLNEIGESYTGETNTQLGAGVFTVVINNLGFGIKEIISTGYIPNSANPQASKVVRVKASTGSQNIAFRYAVQIGERGLTMDSNSRINGNVYSNGNIQGDSVSRINGDAAAVGTISSPTPLVTGTKQAGAPSQPFPTFDEQYWKDQANKNNDPQIGNLELSGTKTLGPRKIQGNLTLKSNTNLTLNGPIWVTGNLQVDSGSQLFINSAFASSGTVVLVEGSIDLDSNTKVWPTNSSPKGYILFVSTKGTGAGNAIQLDSNVTGGVYFAPNGDADLDSSVNIVAITAQGLHLDSNAELNYDLGLASANFSAGPGGGWEISPGTYKID